jgi:competence protein ComEC
MRRAVLLAALLLLTPALGSAQARSARCVDINSAPVAQLQRIVHINSVRADEIVRLRTERPFASVEQLTRVRGIAAKRLTDIVQQGLACVRRPAEPGARGTPAGR